jgi:hypothetical protein
VFFPVKGVDFLKLVKLNFLLDELVVDFLLLVEPDFWLGVVGREGGGETLAVLDTLPSL